jgi:hypothetical protein
MGNIKIFQITNTTPSPNSEEVDVLSEVRLSFNTDVDVKSLRNGLTIIGREENDIILGTVTYDKNRTVIFKPAIPFKASTTYDVYVKSSIKNILGMRCKPFSFNFTTKDTIQFSKPILKYPANESISNTTPEFVWEEVINEENIKADLYEIELSKSEYFDTNYWVTQTPELMVQCDTEIEPGILLFWRVRALNKDSNGNLNYGQWSDVFRFIIAKSIMAPIVEQDGEYIDPAYDDLPPIDNYLLNTFPEYNFSNVGTNLKTIYVEINGLIDISTINPKTWVLDGNHVTGNINIDDYDPEENDDDDEVNHRYLSGKWFVVLDEDNNKTVILFQPDKL